MIKVISHTDIASNEMSALICNEIAKYNHVVYLTATAVIRDIRSGADEFASLEKPVSFLSILDFEKKVRRQVYADGNCLSNADQRYVLSRVIENYFRDDARKHQTYHAIRFELFDLFNDLSFAELRISKELVEKIGDDYSDVEMTIFDIYRHYRAAINSIIGTEESTDNEIEFSLLSEPNDEFNTFAAKQKEYINKIIMESDALFLDGFLFFDDLQSYIIKSALEQEKTVYIVSKQFADGMGRFILEDALKPFLEAFEGDLDYLVVEQNDKSLDTALDIAKKHYPNIFIDDYNKAVDLSDGSIRLVSPFVNREEELRYVVRSISNKIRESFDGTAESVFAALSDIAIVTAIGKSHYEQRIDDLFADVGVFILNEKYADCFDGTITKIYFSKAEFLEDDIKDADGVSITFEEKLSLFGKCYHKIQVNNHIRPLNSYPVGQFVLRLYEMVSKGISVEAFKSILYSNWKYCTGETNIKWSRFISDFKYIEHWFAKSNQTEEWVSILTELISSRAEIINNPLYRYHPLCAVKEDNLAFFREILMELNSLLLQIKDVSGSIECHVTVLKDVVMKADYVLDSIHENDIEQRIIARLINTLADISSSSVVNDVSSQFFAENIRAMLKDYENEDNENESPLRIAVVNLENVKNYGTSYFIMCEADKYPRAYDNRFPYTDEMVSILANDEYGFNAVPSKRFGRDYHLKLERYLLKNVLDFTRDELIITYTEKEAGNDNGISVFAENLATMFDSDIVYEPNEVLSENKSNFVENKTSGIFCKHKDNYTVTELAKFKLCPRLYYHEMVDGQSAYNTRTQLRTYLEAILFCDLMQRFMDYNTENKKVYDIDDSSYIDVLCDLSEQVLQDNSKHFSFFSRYELEDAGKNAHKKAYNSIENSKNYVKGNSFTLINYKDSVYKGDGYTVTVEHDNRFVDYNNKTWRMSQNSTYLEFLVLKTNDRKSELVHYADMIKALDENNADEDRINLVSRIIAKINIQFDSKRFAADGIKRTNDLVRELDGYDFADASAMSSNYCNYCRMKTVCMGK